MKKRILSLLLALVLLPAAALAAEPSPFRDVPQSASYAAAVAWCAENGLMNGMEEGVFAPDGSMTRAMLATVLYRQAGRPQVDAGAGFADVPPGAWYADAVAWAARSGLLRGYGDGNFGPELPVTKEMLDVVMARQKGLSPGWTGAPELAKRSEAAVALYKAFAGPIAFLPNEPDPLAERKVKLNSGYEMPILGLGTWTQDDATAESSVYEALKAGHRLIDTAQYYGNEAGVGAGVRRAMAEGLVTREEVFVTSKVMPANYQDAAASIAASNQRLGLGYIDLMLVHQPGSHDKDAYAALEQAVKDGVVRSIGISNYYTEEAFAEMLGKAEIMPAVVQNENHIFYQNATLQAYLAQYGTVLESYYPFGGRGHTKDSMEHAVIQAIAQKYGKTGAQVILRWHLQAGYIAIPGSSDPEHIRENFNVFDFSLTQEEMAQIAALDTAQRYESW